MGKARVKRWQIERAKKRRLLRVAFAIMELMFFVELGFGLLTISAALQVDALETASSKPITDAVLDRRISARTEMMIEMAGGVFALALCFWVVGVVVWNLTHRLTPDPRIMALISTIGLLANATIARLFYRDRLNSSTLRAAWVASRNDVLGNISVLVAAGGVYITNESWPDAVGAAAILPFAFHRAITAIRNARAGMR